MQQHYGIDLDHAMSGAHTAHHVACLAVQLPPDARIRVAGNADNRWTLNDVLIASVLNSLNGLIYGMSDRRKRGSKPEIVGPSWMQAKNKRSLPARTLEVGELMKVLSLPRR